MINIEYKEELNEELYKFIDSEFNKYSEKNGVVCNYKPFAFLSKEDGKTVGIITGHSYYEEVHIGDLVIIEEYRHKNIGSQLVQAVEEKFKGKGFNNINLSTFEFEALGFYKKCGYEVEFTRENKGNPKLTKYFLIKYL